METTTTNLHARLFGQPQCTLNQSVWWAGGLALLDLVLWTAEGAWWLSHNGPPATPPLLTILSPIHFVLLCRIVAHLTRINALKGSPEFRPIHTPPIVFSVMFLMAVAAYFLLAAASKL